MSTLKRRASFAFTPIFIGMIGLYSLTRRPRFAAIHTVDVLQLIACGMCFGVALVILFGNFRDAREAPDAP